MFTGIVQGIGDIQSIQQRGKIKTFWVALPEIIRENVSLGASLAMNGCCLTITHIEGTEKICVALDAIEETLRITNLDQLTQGDCVNLERAVRFGDEIGGHCLSGHIFCTLPLLEKQCHGESALFWFSTPKEIAPYLFYKGFIAIDGVSLTISDIHKDRFCVHAIPETLARTIMSNYEVHTTQVNVEIDAHAQITVETVKRLMSQWAWYKNQE